MWANAFVGIPFRDRGRGSAGCDCWGLYRLALAEMAGVTLPMWETVSSGDLWTVCRTLRAEAASVAWIDVAEPRDFDLVLMRGHYAGADGQVRGGPVHVGCFVATGHVLHTEEGIDSMIVPVTREAVAHRIVRYYRPAALA